MQNRYIDLRSILRYGLATTKVVQPERLIDVKSNYQNLILVSPGIKNDSANRNYLVTRILGWPKGAPIFERLFNWNRMIDGYSQLRQVRILKGNVLT